MDDQRGQSTDHGTLPDDPVYEYPYTDASPTISFTPPSTGRARFPLGVAGGFIAAVLLMGAGVGAYFGIRALTADDMQQTFTLSGTLSLRADSISTSGLPREFACAGKGGYQDIGPRTAVTVTNEGGTLLAKGDLDTSFGEKNWCVFTFNITGVPTGAKFYKVEVSHRGEMSYTEQEARRRVELSLGDSTGVEAAPAAPPPALAPAPAPPAPAPGPPPPASGPMPADQNRTVPAYSTQCAPGLAVGSTKTSCAFAQQVWGTYMNQSRRSGVVVIYPYSPVTGKVYEMTCTGQSVVTCTGGDNAVIYLY